MCFPWGLADPPRSDTYTVNYLLYCTLHPDNLAHVTSPCLIPTLLYFPPVKILLPSDVPSLVTPFQVEWDNHIPWQFILTNPCLQALSGLHHAVPVSDLY